MTPDGRRAARRVRSLMLCLVACAGLSACGPGRPPHRPGRAPVPPAPGPDDLQGPAALAIDGRQVYIVDVPAQVIRRLDLDTRRLTTIVPREPVRYPVDIAVARDHALVVGEINRVVRLDPATGGVTLLATAAALQRARYGGMLTAVATDAGGGIHLAGFDRVGRLEPDGTVSGVSAPLGTIGDLLADADGTLFVSVTGPFASLQRILRVGAGGGPVTTVVGPGTPVRGADGSPQPRVTAPYNLAVDPHGHLVFSDRTRILRWDRASGTVQVVSAQHPAEAAWAGLVVAADGTPIVSDHFANRVRRIDLRSGRLAALAGRHTPLPVLALPERPSTYPYPVDETCSNDPGDAVLEVRAQGGRGTPVPDAAVRLFAPDGAATRDAAGLEIKVMTDRDGVARLRLATSGDYALTVFRPGYLPAVGAVRLSTSCTARLPVPLTPAPLP
ncbi:MAG: hypothetical protein ABIT71_13775 [Vicinamibacteraceae bacterium]